MLVKTKKPIPPKPEPVCGQAIRCTNAGELMVHQTNQSVPVGDGVNRTNKDGVLILGDDGQYLRNVRVLPDGTLPTQVINPVDINLPPVIEVKGTVDIGNSLTVKPIMVLNVPEEIRVQENLNVVQTPQEAKVVLVSFEGRVAVVIPHPCKIFSIHLTVCEPTWIEIPGIAGEMYTKDFNINLFPLFVQVDKLVIKVREYLRIGGYVIYEV